MTIVETVANVEGKLRPVMTNNLPGWLSIFLMSQGRKAFLNRYVREKPEKREIPKGLEVTCWGLKFQSPLFNAAGMFKDEDAHDVVYAQGAGAYLRGTDEWIPYKGNKKKGIRNPVASFPTSGASINWLGLPGDGVEKGVKRVSNLEKREGCPIGVSLMADPRIKDENERLEKLVMAMNGYFFSGVGFEEINFSCPNTGEDRPDLTHLESHARYIGVQFSGTPVPTVAKLSNDWPVELIPQTMDILFENGFSGVNFGNTSTAYQKYASQLNPKERKLFDYFTKTFGGGFAGRPLKETSLELAATAARYVKAGPPSQEFHVIRTGGIESWNDIRQSMNEGISLNNWFTGHWDSFAKHGHDLYVQLFNEAA